MLLRIKVATSGFVSENDDVVFLNTYFEPDPAGDEEDSEPDSDEDEREDEDNAADDGDEIHRIDEESRRLDEIYFCVR